MRMFALAIGVFCSATLAWGADPVPATNPAPAEGSTPAPATTAPVARKRLLHEHPILQRMLTRNNGLRQRIGLGPHRISPELTKAAQDHAWYMANNNNFDHYSNLGPQGRAAKYGYQGSVRENIAMGQGDVDGAFGAWQASGAHWASIVSGTMDAGFGYAVSKNGTPFWVGMYGYPSQAKKVEVLKPAVPAQAPMVAPMVAPLTTAPVTAPSTASPPAAPAAVPAPKTAPATGN